MSTNDLRNYNCAESSSDNYKRSNVRFVSHLTRVKTDLVHKDLLLLIESSTEKSTKVIKEFIDNGETCPIVFENLTVDDFVSWILGLRTATGGLPRPKTLANHKSALYNLLRFHDLDESEHYKKFWPSLRKRWNQIKRKRVKAIENLGLRPSEGKEDLSFRLLETVAKRMISLGGKDLTFAHCFMLLCWNLVSRSKNIVTLRNADISWKQDALEMYFYIMKTDQLGERSKDPRHVYANPLKPWICPILSMGIYLATKEHATGSKSKFFFDGDSQYSRFSDALKRVIREPDIEQMIKDRGINVKDIGTHSLRKGATTLLSSGTTGGPSSAAIQLRGGWSMPGSLGSYFKFERAMDQFAGRVVVGLPEDDVEFALLPPHFEVVDDFIRSCTKLTFNNLPEELMYVAEFCLASLVFHEKWLDDNLPKNHRLRLNPLFADKIYRQLKSRVLVSTKSKVMKASGVPPLVVVLRKMKNLTEVSNQIKEQLIQLEKKNDENQKSLAEDVVNALEEKALCNNVVTFSGLHQALEHKLKNSDIAKDLTSIKNILENMTEGQSPTRTLNEEFMTEEQNDSLTTPSTFDVPECSISQLWVLFHCGIKSKGWPPFKELTGKDMPSRKLQKRFSAAKRTIEKMNYVFFETEELNMDKFSVASALQIFNENKQKLNVSRISPKKRKRRIGDLSWSTLKKEL